MAKYALQRLLLAVPTILIVSVAVFAVVRFLPGNAIDLLLAQNTTTYEGDRERLEEDLGLNEPLVTGYFQWIGGAVRMDFGDSFWTKQPAADALQQRLPPTLLLGALTMLISITVAIPVGLLAAYYQDGPLDYGLRGATILGLAVPSFWIATIVVVLTSKYMNWSPAGKYVPFGEDPWAAVQSMLIPAAILGIASGAALMRYVRTQALEVLKQDYVRTARAKGVKERYIVLRHAMPNALIPVVTVVGLQLPIVVGGSVIIERIFSIPGIGSLTIEAITRRDYPVIQMINLFFALFVVSANLVVDLCYPIVDPRLRRG